LAKLQTKTFVVTLISLDSNSVKTVSVAPIYSRNNEDVLGGVTDTYNFKICTPACTNPDICVNGRCVCTETRTDEEVCIDEEAGCGNVQDICGDIVDCDEATGGCVDPYSCSGNSCVPFT
jgi:hypothetical protein